MKERVIAVDCDDVIIDVAPSIIDFYNGNFGTSVPLKDFYSNDNRVWGVEDQQLAIDRVNSFFETPYYRNLQPRLDALRTIPLLKGSFELHIVTGRPDHMAEHTTELLDTYFPGVFSSVVFTNLFTSTPRSKADVCADLGAEYLIDDHLHHASVVAERGIKSVLFGDYPWNATNSLPTLVARASGWNEVGTLLLSNS